MNVRQCCGDILFPSDDSFRGSVNVIVRWQRWLTLQEGLYFQKDRQRNPKHKTVTGSKTGEQSGD